MLDNLIKSLEDIRDGNYPGTMKAASIVALLPDVLRALYAIKESMDFELEPYCTERLGKCACTDRHYLQGHYQEQIEDMRESFNSALKG